MEIEQIVRVFYTNYDDQGFDCSAEEEPVSFNKLISQVPASIDTAYQDKKKVKVLD